MAPSAGIEPAAYRLGGGRSIRLSYEGEGGALCGALLPITVFLVVKATGGPGLASWDRALAVSGRDEATCLPLSGLGSGSGGEGQLSVLFEDVGRNTINEMDSKGQSIRAGVDLVSEPPGS